MSRMLLWLQWPVSRPHLHKPAWQPGNPSQHEPHEAAPGPGRPAQADPHYLGCDVIKRTFLDSWFVLKPARVSKVHELNTTFKKQAKPTFFWSGFLCWCSITVVGIKLKSSSITSLSLVYLLTTSNTSSKELLSVTNMSLTAHCSGRGVGGNCLVSALHVSGTLVTLTGHQEQVCGARGPATPTLPHTREPPYKAEMLCMSFNSFSNAKSNVTFVKINEKSHFF